MDAAQIPAPQLGRILVAAGLLSEEQLARALEEQERTGRRLGEIIVQRGFISGPALANALAEQHGGVLKTEYGFASGLGGVAARRAASEAGTAVSPLRPPDPTPISQLRAAEPQREEPAPESPQEAVEPEDPIEPTSLRHLPLEPTAPPEPQPPAAERFAETIEPSAQEPPEPGLPPLLRTAEPQAPPAPPSVPEPELETPPAPESEPALPAATADLVPEPVELRPLAEPRQESPSVFEPDMTTEATGPAEASSPGEAAEAMPELVEIRPSWPEPAEEEPAADEPELAPEAEPEPIPAAEAAEPLSDPVELRPPAPELLQEPPRPPELTAAPEPKPQPAPSAEAAEPVEFAPLLAAPPEQGLQEPESEPDPEAAFQPEPEPIAAVPDDRDELIESLRARVEAQERELAKLSDQLEQEGRRAEVQVHVWPDEQPVPAAQAPAQKEHYLLCVPTTAGYVLLDRVGALPSIGQPIDVPEEEGRFTVTKVVRLPRNGRPCAYLQRA